MTDFQSEKTLVRNYYAALDSAGPDQIAGVLEQFLTPDSHWRGYHPFYEQFGPTAIADQFWTPFRQALSQVQRRMDVFFAGLNENDGRTSKWVVSMGHLMGLFDAPWLGIAPTRKLTFLRYAEFLRIENGRIAESALYIDIPHLMIQAGYQPFPETTAQHLIQPGPQPHNGLLFEPQDPAEGQATVDAINHMVSALKNWDNPLPLEEELALSWHDDMLWWGPAGIGSTYTIERYAKQHSGPFREIFSDRVFNGHICKTAEGAFGGFFGWPNLTLTPTAPFSGLPTKPQPTDMRVIDIYRRDGDKLAENWIFIDMPHFWHQQGVDLIGDTLARGRA